MKTENRNRELAMRFVYAWAALCAAWLCAHSALARDPTGKYANSPHKEWFRAQYNSDGQWCCDESDGHEYDDDYSINQDGSVTVKLNGKPHVIPKNMVLTGANPTGHAIWWFIEMGGDHIDYCFAPGSLT